MLARWRGFLIAPFDPVAQFEMSKKGKCILKLFYIKADYLLLEPRLTIIAVRHPVMCPITSGHYYI